MKLGHYPNVTLKQARAKADEQRGKIDAGQDPAVVADWPNKRS